MAWRVGEGELHCWSWQGRGLHEHEEGDPNYGEGKYIVGVAYERYEGWMIRVTFGRYWNT